MNDLIACFVETPNPLDEAIPERAISVPERLLLQLREDGVSGTRVCHLEEDGAGDRRGRSDQHRKKSAQGLLKIGVGFDGCPASENQSLPRNDCFFPRFVRHA